MYHKDYDETEEVWKIYRMEHNTPVFMFAFADVDMADLMLFCLERTIS